MTAISLYAAGRRAVDEHMKIQYFNQASDLGSILALLELGAMYHNRSDYENAYRYYARGMSRCDKCLSNAVDIAMEHALVTPNELFTLVRDSCLNNRRDRTILGKFYHTGYGTPVDYAAAIDCYRDSHQFTLLKQCIEDAKLDKYVKK